MVKHFKIFATIRIFSKNNRRQVIGTTSHDADAHIQRVLVPDYHDCYTFQVNFTDAELCSTQIIYKKVKEVLSKLFFYFSIQMLNFNSTKILIKLDINIE